jgi:hypothetical protein
MSGGCRLILAIMIAVTPAGALAAGGAFVVDDAAVDEANHCTAQFWSSAASNHDFIAVAYPTCVVNLGKDVELGAIMQRSCQRRLGHERDFQGQDQSSG